MYSRMTPINHALPVAKPLNMHIMALKISYSEMPFLKAILEHWTKNKHTEAPTKTYRQDWKLWGLYNESEFFV